jgi:programmed cell death protein 5
MTLALSPISFLLRAGLLTPHDDVCLLISHFVAQPITKTTSNEYILYTIDYYSSTSMDNLQPVSNLDPNDVPAGFSMADPNAPSGAAASQGAAAAGADDTAAQKQAVLEQALTPDALARLRRIKLVKPAKAASVENAVVNMAVTGKLSTAITESKLIEMLERGSAALTRGAAAQQKNSISIQRKKYAMDSDDDSDDNDDDLM